MTPLMKGTIVLLTMIALIIPLMTISGYISTSFTNTGSRPMIYIYSAEHTEGKYNIIIRISGIVKDDTLSIYQMDINGRALQQYDPQALINGYNPSEALPIEVTSNENNIIKITLTKAEAGQIIELNIHTSIGTIFQTIQI